MISSIVELEVLSPLFIKGKDLEYGEGFISVNNKVYLINNDNLCKFIGEKTYDTNGIRRDSTPDYIQLYDYFITRPENLNENDMLVHYRAFEASIGRTDANLFQKVPYEYKKKSIAFFLSETNLISGNEKDRERIILEEKLAKGVTSLPQSDNKKFVQNGRDVCFIPGSTIKGAIRNALLWQIMNDVSHKTRFTAYVRNNLARTDGMSNSQKKKYAEDFSNHKVGRMTLQSISFTEHFPKLFIDGQVLCDIYCKHWEAANEVLRDFLRVLKVSDANFNDKPLFKVKTVGTFCRNGEIPAISLILKNKNGHFFTTDLQTIVEETKARFKITIDDKLSAEFFPLGLPGYLRSVDELLKIVNDFFAAVAGEEKIFYDAVATPNQVQKVRIFYETLFPPAHGTFRFRMGWGGGMMNKTQLLHVDETKPSPDKPSPRAEVRNLIMDRQDQVAPKSRCLLIDENHQPLKPLGWCTLRLLTGTEASYFGIDAYMQKAGGVPTIAQPKGSVKALIIDDVQPVMVRVLEGNFKDKEIKMPKINLKNLGLATGSEVFIKLIVQKQQVVSIEYKGKS